SARTAWGAVGRSRSAVGGPGGGAGGRSGGGAAGAGRSLGTVASPRDGDGNTGALAAGVPHAAARAGVGGATGSGTRFGAGGFDSRSVGLPGSSGSTLPGIFAAAAARRSAAGSTLS